MDKKRVLMVDDDEGFLELMRGNLESWGYEVSSISDSMQVLDNFKNYPCDIIILDYRMPKVDGVSVLKEIRKINNEIPVVMFSGYPEAKPVGDSGELGISAFVPKECHYTDTIAALKSVLYMVGKKLDKKLS